VKQERLKENKSESVHKAMRKWMRAETSIKKTFRTFRLLELTTLIYNPARGTDRRDKDFSSGNKSYKTHNQLTTLLKVSL
jgi:hypothetical protein